MVFRHSGKLGDIVYSLPAIAEAGPSRLLINADGAHLHPPGAEAILPLLRAQPYIESADLWRGEEFDHDFDAFRRLPVAALNIAECLLATMGLPASLLKTKWLSAPPGDPLVGNGVLFARSKDWTAAPGVFEELYRVYGRGAFFVGTAPEWAAFQRDIGPIAFAPTRDLLQLASTIAGCRLFIGNQSCPLAIAEGLKVPIICGVYAPTPNCVFWRNGFFPVWAASGVPAAIRGFETLSDSNQPPLWPYVPISIRGL